MSLTSEEKRLLELSRKLESWGRGAALLVRAEALLKSQAVQDAGYGAGPVQAVAVRPEGRGGR